MQDIVYTGPSQGVSTSDNTQFPKGTAVPVDDALATELLAQTVFMTAADYSAAQSARGNSGADSVPQTAAKPDTGVAK